MDNRNNQQQPEERSPQDLAVQNPEQWTTGEEQKTSAERGTEEQPQESDGSPQPQRGNTGGEDR